MASLAQHPLVSRAEEVADEVNTTVDVYTNGKLEQEKS